MMKYFSLDPEVAGGLGRHTVMNVSVHPPIVTKLNYEFEGWLGDVILESFPCFIVTTEAKQALTRLGATGVAFDKVEVTTSDVFRELQPNLKLPPFVWLKASGHPGQNDFGVSKDYRLVVSERVLDVLRPLGISNALIEPFESR